MNKLSALFKRSRREINGKPSSSSETKSSLAAASKQKISETNLGDVLSRATPTSEGQGIIGRDWEYEVFLSFRGEDTRTGFTDHLYESLLTAGIATFRDNEGLRVGENIESELVNAIRRSKISIPIFSQDYASSKWCLIELTHMMKVHNHMVFPIFFDVSPSDVRHQKGTLEEAFRRYEKEFSKETVREWRNALKEVATLKGFEKDKISNGHETKLIKLVVSEVCKALSKGNVDITEDLIGIDDHAKQMEILLDVDKAGVRIVGILGMGGIGKTTIARYMYNSLSQNFQPHCCFLEDLREEAKNTKNLVHLQNQLLSDVLKENGHCVKTVSEGKSRIKNSFRNKKVLIVLDDVGERSQLLDLAGGCDWFGSGSRIIVTTRNEPVLAGNEVYDIYKPKEMDFVHSLRLFSRRAFKKNHPPEDFYDLATNIVSAGGGLPLFFEVVGSFLFNKFEKPFWKSTCEKLKRIPDKNVQDKLKISYDALDYPQKEIFLDIACHFIGMDKKYCIYMWDNSEFYGENGISQLQDLSLLKIGDNNVLWMHDQLRDLGRYIVQQENYKNPGARTRLWSHEDAMHTLKNCKGTSSIETLSLSLKSEGISCFPSEGFKELSAVRYLNIDFANFDGDLKGTLSNLRWLRWRRFPGKNITFPNFCPEKLVILDLSSSRISEQWEGWSKIKMATNLKVLDLSWCPGLNKTPEFYTLTGLERLILTHCTGLVEISPPFKHLKRLTYFDISHCSSLCNLPLEIIKSVEMLNASGCRKLTEISSIGQLQSISDFSFNFSSISELPDSIRLLDKLQRLSLQACWKLVKLPDSIGSLVELQHLDLTGCNSLIELPESLGNLKNLRRLIVSYTKLKKLPDFIGTLEKLEELDASNCADLEELPANVEGLSSLRSLLLGNTKICEIPTSISLLSSLLTLSFEFCNRVQLSNELKLPSSLTELDIPLAQTSLKSIVTLLNLKRLGFHYSTCAELIDDSIRDSIDVGNLTKLEVLAMNRVHNICFLPMKISAFSRLKEFSIICSERLQSLPELPSSLVSMRLQQCESVETLSDLSKLEHLSALSVSGCLKLTELHGLEGLKALTSLHIENCRKLSKLDGLEQLAHLQEFKISDCESLEALSLLNMKKLEELIIKHCPNLIEIRGIDKLNCLKVFDMTACIPLGRLPDLSNDEMLEQLTLVKCKKCLDN